MQTMKFNKHSTLSALAVIIPVALIVTFASANGTSFAALASMGYGGQATMYKQSFAAHLTGPQEVPPTPSTATGDSMFNVTMDEQEIDYTVSLSGINNITDVNLYCARPGTVGPIVVELFNSATESSNMNYSGMITASDLTDIAQQCNPNIHTMNHLVQAMREGSIYINVLTTQYPDGEIRGQLGDAPTATMGNGNTGGSTGGTTPPTNTNQATLEPSNTTVAPGAHIDFNGRNFGHEENVTITLSGSTWMANAHADGGGNFTTGSLTMPTTPGSYLFAFTGDMSHITRYATVTVQ